MDCVKATCSNVLVQIKTTSHEEEDHNCFSARSRMVDKVFKVSNISHSNLGIMCFVIQQSVLCKQGLQSLTFLDRI